MSNFQVDPEEMAELVSKLRRLGSDFSSFEVPPEPPSQGRVPLSNTGLGFRTASAGFEIFSKSAKERAGKLVEWFEGTANLVEDFSNQTQETDRDWEQAFLSQRDKL